MTTLLPCFTLPLFPRSVLSSSTLSTRNGTCLVLGSADHSLKVFTLPPFLTPDLPQPRTLHSKRYGHSEYVPTCALLRDGRIASGGMDGRVCLWDARGVRCTDLVGSSRPPYPGTAVTMTLIPSGCTVSQVRTGYTRPSTPWVLASSYDGSIRAWEVGANGVPPTMRFEGVHRAVVNFVWSEEDPLDHEYDETATSSSSSGKLLSGGKEGKLGVWDFETQQPVVVFTGQEGPVEHILYHEETDANLIVAAGRDDSRLLMWDLRTRKCISKKKLFPETSIPGVTQLRMDDSKGSHPAIVSASLSGTITVTSMKERKKICEISPPSPMRICALQVLPGIIISGQSDGRVLVYDGTTGACMNQLHPCLFDTGSERPLPAIRCISALRGGQIFAGNDAGELFGWQL